MQGAPWRIWQNMREISRITDVSTIWAVRWMRTGPLRGFVETVYELCGRQGSMEFGVRPPNAEGIVNRSPISARWSGWLAGSHRYILKKE